MLCDSCVPPLAVASKKVLILSSDPCLTISVCDTCAAGFVGDENCIVGDPETIDAMYDEEEFLQVALLRVDARVHYCRCCCEWYECNGDDCTAPRVTECDTCIKHEDICYSNNANG